MKNPHYVLKYNLTPHSEGEKEEDGRDLSLYLELGTSNLEATYSNPIGNTQCLSLFGFAGMVEIDMTGEQEIEDFFDTVAAMRTIYYARKSRITSTE